MQCERHSNAKQTATEGCISNVRMHFVSPRAMRKNKMKSQNSDASRRNKMEY